MNGRSTATFCLFKGHRAVTVSRTIGASNPSSDSWSCPLKKCQRHLGDGEKNDGINWSFKMIWIGNYNSVQYPLLCGENKQKTYLQIQHRNHSEDRSFCFLNFSLWILFISRVDFVVAFPLVSKKNMLAHVFWLELFGEILDEQLEKPKNQAVGFIKTPPWDQVGDISKIIGSCCESCHEISEAKVEIFRKSIWMEYVLKFWKPSRKGI